MKNVKIVSMIQLKLAYGLCPCSRAILWRLFRRF